MRSGTSDAISSAILAQLKIDNLSIEKCLGLDVDGASVNVGNNHSLTIIFHQVNSKIVTIKCICHSLHLAAEKACESLPMHLDFMVKHIIGLLIALNECLNIKMFIKHSTETKTSQKNC